MMTDSETLRLLLEELRAMRQELHEHVRDEGFEFQRIRQDIGALQRDVAVNKTKLASITAGISAVVAVVVSWVVRVFHP